MNSQRHQLTFRPRARLVSVLGEHLISDQAVGIIELVKNSYDADATEVDVQILDVRDPPQTTVIIQDDGCGMSLDDFTNKWLSPAVDHKEREKHAQHRTARGRIPIGEKGVGRFAVHQIGRMLELVTRARGHAELVVQIDWDTFDSGEKYLDTMDVHVLERSPEIFLESKTGTRLTIRGPRTPWQERLLKKIHRTLRLLQNPVQEDERKPDFRIRLRCPEFPQLEDITPSDLLAKAHYEFRALVMADGHCDYEYICKHPGLPARKKTQSKSLLELARADIQGPEPRSGSFYLNLYVWDRSKGYLVESGVSRDELDAQCGVSIFRDGLRVLPYGEPGDDWLLLDQERIQAPTERIGNNNVIGMVQVDQSTNLLLRDKTNREGLIENEAFLDLRALVRAAVKVFTNYWKKDRPRSDAEPKHKAGSVEVAKSIATAIKKTARSDVEVVVPQAISPADQIDVEGDASTPRVVSQSEAVELLIDNLNGAEHLMRDRETRLDILIHLAATGLAAERVVHEFGRQVTGAFGAVSELRRIMKDVDRGQRVLKTVETSLAALRNEFRVLAPYEAVERAQRTGKTSVKDAVELAFALNRNALDANNIEATAAGDDLSLQVRAASLVQILDNLVHNACYWLSSGKRREKRRLAIIVFRQRRRIVVADNGPGIDEEAEAHVFQPFYSMKTAGKGLGLYISQELAKSIRLVLRLARNEDRGELPEWATGAVFVLDFKQPI